LPPQATRKRAEAATARMAAGLKFLIRITFLEYHTPAARPNVPTA